jgi:hypothetical protein
LLFLLHRPSPSYHTLQWVSSVPLPGKWCATRSSASIVPRLALPTYVPSFNRAERAGALALGSSLLGTTATVSIAEDLPFLSATASEITANIASKKSGWNATRVLQAYVRSSLRAQEGFNPLTEVMYKEAFEMAAALDKNFVSSKQGSRIGC